MKIVLDTNVLISGLLNSKGISGKIVNLIINEKIILLYDNRILDEYKNVLYRKKFKLSNDKIDPIIDFIKNEGIFTIPNPILDKFNDEDDKKFLEVALSGNADYLITGNLRHFPDSNIIVSPTTFFEKINNQ